jgi:hypothetical protein
LKGLVQLDAAIGLAECHHSVTKFDEVFALHGGNTRAGFFSLRFGGERNDEEISHEFGS